MDEVSYLTIDADLDNLVDVRRFVEQQAILKGATEQTMIDMVLAVDEAVTNVILHGYRGKPGKIEIAVSYDKEILSVAVRDWSSAFDPNSVPTPDLMAPLEKRPIGGLGVHIMRQLTDEMVYRRRVDGWNELLLVKKDLPKARIDT
jgi:serine/threonine-protein kinase RsbW